MAPQLLDIHPRELIFLFELKKQSSCSIRLVNKSHHYVAFKVKTTSPKKYCVRPNVGIIMPKSSCEFAVTMQAQRSAPPDMSCKDKFLVQSTIVAAGTSDEDITSAMFSKEEGHYLEENKLRVSLISPHDSPVPSPTNGKVEYENKGAPFFKDGSIEDDFVLHELISSLKDVRNKPENKLLKVTEEVGLKPYTKDVREDDNVEEAKLIMVVQQMKLKLSELESKLSQLSSERQLQRQRILKQEQELSMSFQTGTRSSKTDGFPLLFVIMVAFLSLIFGYFLR